VAWTETKIDKLRQLWNADELSAALIAEKLGVTRNAVIGKAARLGLKTKDSGRPRKTKERPIKNPDRAPQRAQECPDIPGLPHELTLPICWDPPTEIISRAQANAWGLKYYFTGKPCAGRHIAGRRTANKHCLECERQHEQKRVRKRDRKYFTGTPCLRGHIAERDGLGFCLECERERRNSEAFRTKKRTKSHEHYWANIEKELGRRREWSRANRDAINDRRRRRRAENPEQRRKEIERLREWVAAHPDHKRKHNPKQAREAKRRWKLANPERVRDMQRKWRAANPEKVRQMRRRQSRNQALQLAFLGIAKMKERLDDTPHHQ
jgi:GcrA cell cycle regulator